MLVMLRCNILALTSAGGYCKSARMGAAPIRSRRQQQSQDRPRVAARMWCGLLTMCGLALVAQGCSDSAANACRSDEECASKFCRADGTCAPVAEVDARGLADAADAARSDAVLGCTPNHDGMVTAAEYPIAIGVAARFRSAQNAEVSSAGTPAASGARHWDYTSTLAADADLTFMAVAPTGAWWASKFPQASYAARLSLASDLLGVFQADASGVQLLGVVSPTGGFTRTEIAYSPPVQVLRFPLAVNAHWTTSTRASGVINGAVSVYTEDYDSSVDAHGTLRTPYGEFPVQRVKIEFTQTVGLLVTRRRTFAFVAECFGTVAQFVSVDNPTAGELNKAAEVRRLAP